MHADYGDESYGVLPLRAQVAQMRAAHRAQHLQMAQAANAERQIFVAQIKADVRAQGAQVEQMRAEHRAQHAEMAQRERLSRAAFINSVKAWVG